MNNYKIKVNNEVQSKEAQELFEQLGFTWAGDYPENGDWYSHLYAEKSTCCHLPIYVWNGLGDRFKEITLSQLRDLVVLHRNVVKDANYESAYEEHDDLYFKDSSGKLYRWFCGSHWTEAVSYKGEIRPICEESEQGLISGADALKAMMEGKRVLYSGYKNQDWDTALNCNLGVFLKHEKFPDFSFKIVPRTITLSLEIPAPFEPKDKDNGYVIDLVVSSTPWNESDPETYRVGAWSTEEEIKQVVAALRGIKQ